MGMAAERQHVFAVLVKRSYDIAHSRPLAQRERAEPFLERDVYFPPGDPETCTVLYESELAPYKPATDVVFIAQAYAPAGEPTQALTVGVEVAGQRKLIRVIGDRIASYRAGAPPIVTEPRPFDTCQSGTNWLMGARTSEADLMHPSIIRAIRLVEALQCSTFARRSKT